MNHEYDVHQLHSTSFSQHPTIGHACHNLHAAIPEHQNQKSSHNEMNIVISAGLPKTLRKGLFLYARSPCSDAKSLHVPNLGLKTEGLHNTQTIYPWPGHRVSPAKAGRRSYLVVGVAFWLPFQGLKHEGFTAVKTLGIQYQLCFCKRYQAPSCSYLNMFGLFWDTAPFPILTAECFKHISFSEFFFVLMFLLSNTSARFFGMCFITLFSYLSYRGTKMTTDLIRWFGWSFLLVQMWNITHWSHLWRSQVQRGGSKNPAAPWVLPKAHHLATASRCQGHWAPTAA